jgi:uncharacterized repeat protein (TIGR03803 family)
MRCFIGISFSILGARNRIMKKMALATLIGLFLLALPVRGQINLLHEFAGGSDDGSTPYASLILSGSTLYGMTHDGGDNGRGTIFKIQMDGTNFSLLHEFAGGIDDGAWPKGSLVISGSTLYGMTDQGGDSNSGTIFKIETNGNGFALLHEFADGPDNGEGPWGSLILSGSTLYGMTHFGEDNGTIFKIETDGSGFTLLHSFIGGADDGAYPMDSLILSGSALYGMTYYGGDSNKGTIFKIETNGSGFILLHEFAGGPVDGEYPEGSLILSSSTLYGITGSGGDTDDGTMFKIETNGTGFVLLHEFVDGANDGAYPRGSLLLSGSTLYGTTGGSDDHSGGTIFQIQTDGSDLALLHEFTVWGADGAGPIAPLLISGSTLYGMTNGGGTIDMGVIFSLPLSIGNNITVTSPNGGEIWPLGSTRAITWSSSGVTTDMKLVLFKDGVKVGNIVTNIPVNSGSYKWTVGSYIGGFTTAGTGFTVRAITMDGVLNDFSNAPFTITPLNLISPNGYENWQMGSIHPISWAAPGMSNNIKLVLIKDGVKVGNIATNIPAGAGTYNWTVGNYIGGAATVGSGYTVKVIDMDGVYKDNSEAPFTITASSQLNLTSPNGGESWPLGGTRVISWTDGGYTGNLKLVLFKNGIKLGNVVVDIPAGSSPYTWTVGSYMGGTAEKGEGYSVRVISMDGVKRDESDGPFLIQ